MRQSREIQFFAYFYPLECAGIGWLSTKCSSAILMKVADGLVLKV